MQEFKTKTKLVYWPTAQDYNEAVQNLHVNAHDPEIQGSNIDIGPLGIPRVISGSFASVYKVHSSGRDLAVRCFLRDVPDSRWRYSRISQFVENDRLPYTVGFDYQPQGIRVVGEWFPIVKMEWIAGQTLDNHLRSLNGKFTSDFADRFKKMCWDLGDAGIAHGDLQHGNIIVKENELFLVDYDGMYVPSMQGALSNELGHRNYQHPGRNAQHFGPYLDNFSAWVIYGSLKALSQDASLFEKLGAGEDCLLFRREDFTNPLHSCAFAALEGHTDETIRKLGRYIRWSLTLPPDQVPALGSKLDIDVSLPPLNPNAPTERAAGFADIQSQHQDSTDHWYRTSASESLSNQLHSPSKWSTSSPNKTQPSRIEHELRQPPPRKTRFNRSCKAISPVLLQYLNMINPVMFLLIGAFMAVQSDYNLQRHGVDIPGTIDSSRVVHHSKGPDMREVTYTYNYNDVLRLKFMEVPLSEDVSDHKQITVKVLPSDPTVSSPNFEPEGGAGESELPREIRAHQNSAVIYAIIWLVCEILIWFRPISHREVIIRGTAVRGRITGKKERGGGRRSRIYTVYYDYERATAHGQTTSSSMRVWKKQYDDINAGEEVTIVYIPNSSSDLIYRFSYYKAV